MEWKSLSVKFVEAHISIFFGKSWKTKLSKVGYKEGLGYQQDKQGREPNAGMVSEKYCHT